MRESAPFGYFGVDNKKMVTMGRAAYTFYRTAVVQPGNPDVKKHKLVSLLTNDMEAAPEEIVAVYRQRWEIELLFKQIKQNSRSW